jgi:hypothetical protein
MVVTGSYDYQCFIWDGRSTTLQSSTINSVYFTVRNNFHEIGDSDLCSGHGQACGSGRRRHLTGESGTKVALLPTSKYF